MGAKGLPITGEPFSMRFFSVNSMLFSDSVEYDKKTPAKIPIKIGMASK